MDLTFADFVDACLAQAAAASAPFTASRACVEERLQPVVAHLNTLTREAALAWVLASSRCMGYDSLALRLWEQTLPPLERGQRVMCFTVTMRGCVGTVESVDPDSGATQHIVWVDFHGIPHRARPMALVAI